MQEKIHREWKKGGYLITKKESEILLFWSYFSCLLSPPALCGPTIPTGSLLSFENLHVELVIGPSRLLEEDGAIGGLVGIGGRRCGVEVASGII